MKVRIISALLMLGVLVPVIIMGGNIFIFCVSVIGIMCFYEFINARKDSRKIPTLMKLVGVASFIVLMLSNYEEVGLDIYLDYKIITSIIFLTFMPIVFYKKEEYNIEDALFIFASIFFLGLAFNCLINVRNYNLYYFIFICLITIFTDTFAYTFGSLIGKHKLAPVVSPNKTWEGFFGGLLFGTFISSVFYITAFNFHGNILKLILVIGSLSILGQLGDLVFSAVKRYYKIKDFSNLIPGHGGILDRLDSILFVVLAFSLISFLL